MCYPNPQIPSLGIFSKATLIGMQIYINKNFIKVLFIDYKHGYIYTCVYISCFTQIIK